jgi:hypothetical protein
MEDALSAPMFDSSVFGKREIYKNLPLTDKFGDFLKSLYDCLLIEKREHKF